VCRGVDGGGSCATITSAWNRTDRGDIERGDCEPLLLLAGPNADRGDSEDACGESNAAPAAAAALLLTPPPPLLLLRFGVPNCLRGEEEESDKAAVTARAWLSRPREGGR